MPASPPRLQRTGGAACNSSTAPSSCSSRPQPSHANQTKFIYCQKHAKIYCQKNLQTLAAAGLTALLLQVQPLQRVARQLVEKVVLDVRGVLGGHRHLRHRGQARGVEQKQGALRKKWSVRYEASLGATATCSGEQKQGAAGRKNSGPRRVLGGHRHLRQGGGRERGAAGSPLDGFNWTYCTGCIALDVPWMECGAAV